MTWTIEHIESLREGVELEAKRAGGRDGKGQLPDDFWPTYSAMANSKGGVVLLGVKEHQDGRLEAHGIANPEHIKRELWNLLQNPQKVSGNVLSENDVEQVELEGRTILVIQIPRAPRSFRPVYINGQWETGTYIRIHEGDRLVSKDRVRRMIADAEYETRDDRVLDGLGFEDLDPETVRSWRQTYASREPDHPWLGLPDQGLLQQVGAWRMDRASGQSGPTLAGLLMFGRFESITEILPNYFVDYQEREEGTSIQWSDRVVHDGRWSGNLFDFYRRVIGKLTSLLKVPFRLGADLYRVDETKVHRALREALVNCLIHADYEGRTGILVLKSPAGFSFRNPGGLRLSMEQIRQGGVSDCRNRSLQKMFRMLGLGEQAGSGFSRILEAWKEQHWKLPLLAENVELETTELQLFSESLLPEAVVADLETHLGNRFRELPPAGRIALVTAQAEGRVTHARMLETTDLHSRDITLLFQSLVSKGLLERRGERRQAWYRTVEPEEAQHSSHSGPSSSQSSSQSGSSSSQSSSQSLFPQLAVEQVSREHWSSRADVRRAILELCKDNFQTGYELARKLNREHSTILKNYVLPMVKEGVLVRKFPEQPRHPEQAYRVAG